MCALRFFLISCLLFVLPTGGAAQPEPDTSQWPDGRPGEHFNVTDAKGLKQGRWIRVYPDGRLYYSGSFKDDRPVGHFTFFRESGRVLSEVEHDAATLTAKAILYREDGTPSHRGQYATTEVDGAWTQRKTGQWEALDSQGRVRVVEHYADDQLDGVQLTYHSNGQLLEEGQFKSGRKTGQWKTYDSEGLLRSEEMWREGERHGPSVVMQDNGTPLSKGDYEGGQPVGEWITYNPDGKERSLITYEGGKAVKEAPLNGAFDSAYPSGRPEWAGHYSHGRLDGPFTAWYDLGEWTMVPATVSAGGGSGEVQRGVPSGFGGGNVDGATRRELRNQPMKEMGEYTAGVKDGTWRYFDEQGNRMRTERWNLGRLESTEE